MLWKITSAHLGRAAERAATFPGAAHRILTTLSIFPCVANQHKKCFPGPFRILKIRGPKYVSRTFIQ